MEMSLTVSIPRLETPRLRLREFRMGDFDAYAAHVADPETMRFLGTSDRKTAWRIFGCQTGSWVLQGAGWWAVELLETAETVGAVGAFFREGWPEIELGWNVYRAFWQRGIATEAMVEVVRYALDVRKEKRVTALIESGNTASLRVATKLGLRYESDTELWGKVVGRYVRAAEGAA